MNIKIIIGTAEMNINHLPEHMFHPLLGWLAETYRGQVVEVNIIGF